MQELDNYFNRVTQQAQAPKKPKSRWFKWFLAASLAVFCLMVGFGTAFYLFWQVVIASEPKIEVEYEPVKYGELFNYEGVPDFLKENVDFSIFWDVWRLVQTKHVEQPVGDTTLFYGALRGLVAALGDPYSVFLDPKTTREFNQELTGSFEGIGAELGLRDGQITIIAPLSGMPAEQVGLKAGDKIVSIDGTDTTGMTVEYAVSLIRGPRGTSVTLTIKREGLDEPKEFVITRGTIILESVTWQMIGENQDIAHLELKYFNFDTSEKFNQAVQEIIAKKPRGIILDLRNNPGGLLNTAIEAASEWIGEDVVMFEDNFEGVERVYKGSGLARLGSFKTIVLINGGSASGSEIVAGALKDHGLATLVGEKTFGKGSVQTLENMRDGSSVKLTTAHWLTPNKEAIEGQGIVPDVEVKRTLEEYDAGLDPQLDKAVELLSRNSPE